MKAWKEQQKDVSIDTRDHKHIIFMGLNEH